MTHSHSLILPFIISCIHPFIRCTLSLLFSPCLPSFLPWVHRNHYHHSSLPAAAHLVNSFIRLLIFPLSHIYHSLAPSHTQIFSLFSWVLVSSWSGSWPEIILSFFKVSPPGNSIIGSSQEGCFFCCVIRCLLLSSRLYSGCHFLLYDIAIFLYFKSVLVSFCIPSFLVRIHDAKFTKEMLSVP